MAIDPKKQLPGGLKTVNEEFFDALVRHQIGLLRLSGSIRNDVFAILDATEVDITKKVKNLLAKHNGFDSPASVKKMNKLLAIIKTTRLSGWKDINALWAKELLELAKAEPVFVDGALKTVVPVTLTTTLPSTELLTTLARTKPFEGKTMRQWANNVAAADINRIETQIKVGMVQGESSAVIAQRVRGVLDITKNQAASITRTAVNAVANQAKRAYYDENRDIFTKELYVATLDNRTCWSADALVTMADGSRLPIGEVQEGDLLLGGLTGEPSKVLGIQKTIVSSSVAIYSGGIYVGDTTHGHKMFTKSGWREASDLCLSPGVSKQKVLCRGFKERKNSTEKPLPDGQEGAAFSSAQCDPQAWNTDGEGSSPGQGLPTSLHFGNTGDQGAQDFGTEWVQHDGGRGRRCKCSEETEKKVGAKISENLHGKHHPQATFSNREKGQGGLDERKYGQHESGDQHSSSKGTIGRQHAQGDGEHDAGATFGENAKGLGGPNAQEERYGSPEEGHRIDVAGSESGQTQKDVGSHETTLAGPRVQSSEGGSLSKARSAQEDGGKWGKGCSCHDGRGQIEEEQGFQEIGNRAMVQEKTIWGQEFNRQIEIVSLSVEHDPTYVVGGIIVHNTPICSSLDGQQFPIAEGPIPPLHFNCRSLRVAIIDREVIGNRPARAFTRKQLLKDYTKKAKLSTVTNRNNLPRGHKGKFDDFAQQEMRRLTGSVPAKVSYQQWLTRQSATFQDDVLGITKARLFRKGGLTLKKFVNRVGDELTLSELAVRNAKAFRAAGLDPENFL